MNMLDLVPEMVARFEALEIQLRNYVNDSDLVTDETDPEAGVVFYAQSMARLQIIDEKFSTAVAAQKWLDEITSARKFSNRFKCTVKVVLQQKDSGKSWPATWVCDHVRCTDTVIVTFSPNSLDRAGILYELAWVVRSEMLAGVPARHDREFRRILLNLVGTYGNKVHKGVLKREFKTLKLSFVAVRRRLHDDDFL